MLLKNFLFKNRPKSEPMEVDEKKSGPLVGSTAIASIPGVTPTHHGPLYLASRAETDVSDCIIGKKRMLAETKPSFPPSKKQSLFFGVKGIFKRFFFQKLLWKH